MGAGLCGSGMGQGYVGRVWGRVMWVGYGGWLCVSEVWGSGMRAGLCGSGMGQGYVFRVWVQGYVGRVWGRVMRVGYGAGL